MLRKESSKKARKKAGKGHNVIFNTQDTKSNYEFIFLFKMIFICFR